MHPVRGGAGGEGKEVALHPCSPVSVSMVIPMSWRGREWKWVRGGRERPLSSPLWLA